MHNDDPQAGNLFSRLVSYAPSGGEAGQVRTALEDYCTEALAWCLLHAPQFRRNFVKLIYESSPESQKQNLFETLEAKVEIDTQVTAGEKGESRRFDLVIHSSANSNPSFVIVVEDKVKWSFTEDQIPAYQTALKEGKRPLDFRNRFLVLLSPPGRSPDIADHPIPVIPISWSAVYQVLVELSEAALVHSNNQVNLPAVQFVCAQFANFLTEKGLVLMKLPKVSESLNVWVEGLEFRESLSEILKAVRSELTSHSLKRDVVFEQESGGRSWLGLHGSVPEEELYVGFRLRDKMGNPDFRMLIERAFPKINFKLQRQLGELSWKPNVELENGWMLEQLIKGEAKFDGNAPEIREWFETELRKLSSATLQKRSDCK